MKNLEHSEPFTIETGQSYLSKSFQPRAGFVVGCSIYHNNTDGSINPNLVSAKIVTDSGEEISPLSDIRHYRNRESGYYEGLKPLNFETNNKTYRLEIIAQEAFTGDFVGNLVFVFKPEGDC
ncbi:hypothetical protein GR160_02890 [Flavobacterium sp. Sd200]|uniref:hypothetical protein n=1 Tax=Flavobacterium sp. Sd200 TaxID=2692211 RepID=UPI00136C32A9|nr:hypothetical protein [Flavobacterium sp. Sd200]MXN90160.1 hypothetical protein [Flavobacterium sp. Sd200]